MRGLGLRVDHVHGKGLRALGGETPDPAVAKIDDHLAVDLAAAVGRTQQVGAGLEVKG